MNEYRKHLGMVVGVTVGLGTGPIPMLHLDVCWVDGPGTSGALIVLTWEEARKLIVEHEIGDVLQLVNRCCVLESKPVGSDVVKFCGLFTPETA